MDRPNKENYYLDIAETVSERSTCLRRHYGTIIVKNDQIVSTGYSGAPRGRKNCNDIGTCFREKHNIPRGERYELCRSVHAEQNSIIHAARNDMIGATMYMVGKELDGTYTPNANSCALCKRFIINSGISKVVIRDDKQNFRTVNVEDWISNDDSLDMKLGY